MDYGIDRQRVVQTFTGGKETWTKRYFTPLYETVTMNGETKNLHYVTSATGIFAIFVTQNSGTGTMYYTLKDHQGSLAATIHGNNVERLSYDPWGRRRNITNFGYDNVSHTFDRGYTLHEHYDEFDLINMNGRVYDPVLSSFLSVDQYVQSPDNAQGFNRYAYCMNNPLKYVDPSGWRAGGGIVGYTPNTASNANDPYAFVEHGGFLEPRDFGWRQLPTSDPIITWMEENSLHGGGIGTKGGWYQSKNEFYWDPRVSSQSDLDALGISGSFIGQNFADEKNRTYYSLLGYKVDMKEGGGIAGEIFPLIDIALCKYENDKLSMNKDIFDHTIAEPSTTNFGVIKYVSGSDNIYSFATNNFIVYLQVFDGSSGKRENSMNAAFCGFSDSYHFNPNNHYGLSKHTSFEPGFNLYFNNPYANSKCWRVMIVFPTIPVRNSFIDRYNNVFGYGNH